MELVVAGRVGVRASLLWLTVTAALGGLAALTAPLAGALVTGPGPSFADALVQACAATALLAGAALWLVTTEVAGSLLRAGGVPPARPGHPGRPVGPVRLALLAACGVSVLATAPAHAGSDTSAGSGTPLTAEALDGLPLPDRPAAPRLGPDRPSVVTVRPGDSLWAIAARRLGPGASPSDVASYWRRVVALNSDAVGHEPDLIQPGQTLRLPPT